MRFAKSINHKREEKVVKTFLLSFFCLLAFGCGNTMDEMQLFDRQDAPFQTVRGATIVRSERGDLQFEMHTPLIVRYNDPESKTLYPEGVEITFFDSQRKPKAFFTARSATQYDDRDLIEARDSVVLIDHQSHDTVYLQDLIWDSKQQRVFSDHPVHAVNGNRVTYGDSFESDDSFTHPQILHQHGTIEWNENEEDN